jgi:hypothetical protein
MERGNTMTDKTTLSHPGTPYGLNLFCALLLAMILLLDLFIPLGVAVGVLYVVPVLLSLWSSKKGFTVLVAVVASVLTIGAYFYKPAVPEMWKVLFNRSLSLIAIGITAILGLQRKNILTAWEEALRDREMAIEKLKILSGLLPICASCKKIRDDQGYWNDVAGYISEHSEAEFSHGICPACAEKLYPEYYKKSEHDQNKK